MDYMEDQESQSDYYGEIKGNNILGVLKKSSLLVDTPKSPRGDLLIIRDFHTPLGGQGVKKVTFSTAPNFCNLRISNSTLRLTAWGIIFA